MRNENKLNMNSEMTMYFFRQMVARTVLDTLRQVSDVSNDIEAVFAIVARLAQDIGKQILLFVLKMIDIKKHFSLSNSYTVWLGLSSGNFDSESGSVAGEDPQSTP